ncbi:MAG TPA: murein biosynthesis integral membrane protein MurJ [Humibacter sp.]|nr:murein biosynthesis integral membrane protein MurJ [Humibacter sp.]
MAPSIGRASTLLASGTLVSRVLGFAKSWLLIQAIGIHAGGDAYTTATIVPNSIYAVITQGLLNAILVPQIVRAAAHPDGGRGYINKLVTLGMTIFLGVTVVATVCSPWLMHAYGLHGEQAALATAFAYWSMPQIFFLGLYTLLGEVLNARESFGPFTWAPVFNNIVGIVMLGGFMLLFGGDPNSMRLLTHWSVGMVVLLAGGATLGIASQALVLFFFWRHVGLRYRPDFAWRGVNFAEAGRAAGWTFAMLMATQLAGLVETNVANSASGRNASVIVMTQSWAIFILPYSVIALSIVTAYYTRMANHARENDYRSFRSDLSAALRSIAVTIAICSAVLIVTAYPIARFFTSSYAQMGNVLIAYLVGLVPLCLLFVLQRSFYALGDTRTPFIFTCVQVAINVSGSLACLAVPIGFRAAAIALVVSFAGTAQTILAAVLLRRRLRHLGGRMILTSLAKHTIAAVVAAAVGFGTLIALGGTSDGFAVSDKIPALISAIAIGAVMLLVYLIGLAALRTPELRDAIGMLKARLAR